MSHHNMCTPLFENLFTFSKVFISVRFMMIWILSML